MRKPIGLLDEMKMKGFLWTTICVSLAALGFLGGPSTFA